MSNENEKNLDYLYSRRERLDHDRFELSNAYDKYLFTAASGAIALIIGFADNLGSSKYFCLLAIGILLFFFCIIAALLSILFSIQAHKKQVDITDVEIQSAPQEVGQNDTNNPWNAAVRWSSIAASLLFVAGGVCAAAFYLLNIY